MHATCQSDWVQGSGEDAVWDFIDFGDLQNKKSEWNEHESADTVLWKDFQHGKSGRGYDFVEERAELFEKSDPWCTFTFVKRAESRE